MKSPCSSERLKVHDFNGQDAEAELVSAKYSTKCNSSSNHRRLQSKSIDNVPDAGECMSERSTGEDDVPPSSDHCFGKSKMVGDEDLVVECFPDYVVYGDKYYTASVITFSSSCIELERSTTAHGENGTFLFRWAVDDIINIESESARNLVMVKIRVISKGTSVSKEELKFVRVAEDWDELQDAIISLDVYKSLWKIVPPESDSDLEMRDAESSKHYFPIFSKTFEDVIYPKGDPDAVSIKKSRDIDLLQPDMFLNDTIIDFYIKYLNQNKTEPGERHRFHFFNSFFFRKLANTGDKASLSPDIEGRAAFHRVRRWTRNINLFDKDFVLISVNFNHHWSLIVVCHPGEVAEFQEADAKKCAKVPCILHMDSIKGCLHSGLEGLLRSYLLEEWKHRQQKADTSEEISSRFLNLRFLSLDLPQQPNSSDCGLFLLHYAELFLEGVPVNFNPFKITKFSGFLTPNWFLPAEACLKRSHIERLIDDLLDEGSREIKNNCSSKFTKSFNENGTENFLSKRCSPTKSFRGNVPSFQAGEGLALTMLAKNSQSASDSGFFLRELVEPRGGVRSFNEAFEQREPNFDGFEFAMPPVDREDETDGHFGYHLAAAETEFDRLAANSYEFITEEHSWNHQIAHEDIDSLTEASIHASNDSLRVEKMDASQIATDEQTWAPLIDNVPSEMLDSNSQNNADPVTPCCKTRETGMGACEGVKSICDDSAWEPKVQHATKKRRFTALEEEGELHGKEPI